MNKTGKFKLHSLFSNLSIQVYNTINTNLILRIKLKYNDGLINQIVIYIKQSIIVNN